MCNKMLFLEADKYMSDDTMMRKDKGGKILL